jgi:16S rRNA (guanine527-N7)-methyltransferase
VSAEETTDDPMVRLRALVDPALDVYLRRSFELGFLGNMPIADQVDHALGFVALLEAVCGEPPLSVVDLGTGGGVPGLVLASCWPETRVALLDANERRTAFLREVVEGWPGGANAEVIRGRAEELGRTKECREQFAAVTSRSFGLPAATAECGASLLAVGGSMVVSEPPDPGSGDRWPEAGLALLGLAPEAVLRPTGRFGYQLLTKVEPLDDRFPRRVGIPVKRPVF